MPALQEHLSYWKERLSGTLPLTLPTDRPRRAVQTFRAASHSVTLPEPLPTQLRGLGQQEGVNLFVTLVASFQVLLSRYADQDDVLVGASLRSRDRVEDQPLIGPTVRTVMLRTDLSGDPSFRELLARVSEGMREAMAHKDLPFERLVEELELDRGSGQPPLPQVMFTLMEGTVPALERLRA